MKNEKKDAYIVLYRMLLSASSLEGEGEYQRGALEAVARYAIENLPIEGEWTTGDLREFFRGALEHAADQPERACIQHTLARAASQVVHGYDEPEHYNRALSYLLDESDSPLWDCETYGFDQAPGDVIEMLAKGDYRAPIGSTDQHELDFLQDQFRAWASVIDAGIKYIEIQKEKCK